MKRRLLLLLTLGFTGCASVLEEVKNYIPENDNKLMEAQTMLSRTRVNGVYELEIKAGHKQGQFVYLNTQPDNQHPGNITVTIAPDIARKLAQRYATSPEAFFVNKTIRVNGEARQVKMWEYEQGRRTNKYFYQTRINVQDAAQISL